MINNKILASIIILFDQDYKLPIFLKKYLNMLKSNKINSIRGNMFNMLNYWFKKDIFHIEMFEQYYSVCCSKIIKYGTKTRKLYFHDKELIEAEFQVYKCKKCGKTFKTDIFDC